MTMTVRELREALLAFNPDAEVWVSAWQNLGDTRLFSLGYADKIVAGPSRLLADGSKVPSIVIKED